MASRVFGGRAFDLVQEAAQNTANVVAGAASQLDILADTQSNVCDLYLDVTPNVCACMHVFANCELLCVHL